MSGKQSGVGNWSESVTVWLRRGIATHGCHTVVSQRDLCAARDLDDELCGHSRYLPYYFSRNSDIHS